jgi:hypothetical protein
MGQICGTDVPSVTAIRIDKVASGGQGKEVPGTRVLGYSILERTMVGGKIKLFQGKSNRQVPLERKVLT